MFKCVPLVMSVVTQLSLLFLGWDYIDRPLGLMCLASIMLLNVLLIFLKNYFDITKP